jgi:hypothetical protein
MAASSSITFMRSPALGRAPNCLFGRAALLLLAAGLVVSGLPIALILLRLTGLWSIRCRRLLGFIAHYIIPFGQRPKNNF